MVIHEDKIDARGVVVRSFATEEGAVDAITRLNAAGFTADDISVVARDSGRADTVAEDTGIEVSEGAGLGAIAGGTLGAIGGLLVGASAVALPGIGLVIAGPLAAALAGAGAGALTGGLAGALVGLGVSEDEARMYQDRFQAGDIIVTVVAGEREPEARHALDASSGVDSSRLVTDTDIPRET